MTYRVEYTNKIGLPRFLLIEASSPDAARKLVDLYIFNIVITAIHLIGEHDG